MRKNTWPAVAVLTVLGGALLLAQAAGPSPDSRKVRQELDTMKGILRTSLRYALHEGKDESGGLRFEQDIEAYYLSGQGAVFIVPVHLNGAAPVAPLAAMEAYLSAAEGQQVLSERLLRDLERNVERATRDAARAIEEAELGLVWEPEGEAPEAPEPPHAPGPAPAPEAPVVGPPPPPPPPEAPPAKDRVRSKVRVKAAENARERLAELRARLGQQREDYEQQRKKMEADFSKVREGLIETLSKYGDSLTILRPEESVTLILKREAGVFRLRGPFLAGDSENDDRATVLSVKKSDVSAYKTGSINRAEFLNRVIEYRQ